MIRPYSDKDMATIRKHLLAGKTTKETAVLVDREHGALRVALCWRGIKKDSKGKWRFPS